jgi:hypothetical protein
MGYARLAFHGPTKRSAARPRVGQNSQPPSGCAPVSRPYTRTCACTHVRVDDTGPEPAARERAHLLSRELSRGRRGHRRGRVRARHREPCEVAGIGSAGGVPYKSQQPRPVRERGHRLRECVRDHGLQRGELEAKEQNGWGACGEEPAADGGGAGLPRAAPEVM